MDPTPPGLERTRKSNIFALAMWALALVVFALLLALRLLCQRSRAAATFFASTAARRKHTASAGDAK